MTSKVCKSCGNEKPLSQFSPLKHGKQGRHPHCRACRNTQLRAERNSDGNQVEIYGLTDPVSGDICYVGRSTNSSSRLRQHIAEAKCSPHCNPRKTQWLLKLLSSNQEPGLVILEVCSRGMVEEREAHWILHFRQLNPLLLNGDGIRRYIETQKDRA